MIVQNIERVKASLPKGVGLVAVSKLKPVEDIMARITELEKEISASLNELFHKEG